MLSPFFAAIIIITSPIFELIPVHIFPIIFIANVLGWQKSTDIINRDEVKTVTDHFGICENQNQN